MAILSGFVIATDPTYNFPYTWLGPLILLLYVLILVGVLIQPWISAAFSHLGAWFFHGKGEYEDTFRVMAYGMIIGLVYAIPLDIFNIIMQVTIEGNLAFGLLALALLLFTSLASLVHTVFVEVVGFRRYHKLSTGKSFVSVFIIPLLIIFLIAAVILIPILMIGLISLASIAP